MPTTPAPSRTAGAFAPAPTAATPSRIERWVRALAWLGILVNLVLLMRVLPVDRLVEMLAGRVDTLGAWGPVVFGVVYVTAALLFVPGAALTLAVGAIFGLVGGTIIVSIASTTAAALAFLIARHFARDAVVRRAQTSPRFAAMDEAIREGGWKIVALLRLSPAVPFSLGNYLFGLTPVRFVPYVVTSWIAMLPGTLMYVYLGHAGRQGLAAAAGEGRGRTTGEWVLLGLGLLATIVVTVYVTRLARRALRLRTTVTEAPAARPAEGTPPAARRPWVPTLAAAAVALLLLGANVFAYAHRARLAYLFGPPAAKLAERYAKKPGGPTFDHGTFDALLRAYVDDAGFVDYRGLAKKAKELDGYIASLDKAQLDKMGRDQRLALLLNAYNAFTLRLILDHPDVASIRDIPAGKRWDDVRWRIGGKAYSLNQIEHELIRPNFKEPRIHFALVCAAVGCPPLRTEAYDAARLEAQLTSQAEYVHSHERWFRHDPEFTRVELTQLYDWYAGDFEQVAGSVLAFAARTVPGLKKVLATGKTPSVTFLDYDWALNSRENKR
ncbi:MAG: DUF547 domain-containing protein [Planctomycetota bacterium]